ncbi:MAG: hypothetical protein QOF27_1838 [Gaiellaceae bacterium]|jgi:hypothetical protein|nr:hypothetical protein [Gaiellaceae bacterium]
MKLTRKQTIFIGAATLLAAAGGGVAVAASGAGSPSQESKAVIDDAAKQLGIPSSKLSGALKQALSNQVDAAVAAGRLTKEQGAELKQRLDSGDFPLIGGLHREGGHHFGFFGGLNAAAGYIGVTEAELRTQIEGGKSLAQVAKDHGKSADGLINALVTDATQKLNKAVSAGRITQAQADEMLTGLKQRITDLVSSTGHPAQHGEGFRHFNGGPFS